MKTCTVSGLDVVYEDLGEGRPILFLPGWSLDHTVETFLYEPIFANRPGWRRLYLDPPGHGRTPGADWVDCADRILDVILGFVDTVLPGQRLALAGTSAGALSARGVVYKRPQSVSGLLLYIPLVVADDAQRDLPETAVLARDEEYMAQISPEEREILAGVIVERQEYCEPLVGLIRDVILPAQARNDETFLARIREDPARYALSFEVDALPEPFQGPSLFVTGRQDVATGYRDAWRLLEQYPRATYIALDRAGHSFMHDKQPIFQALVHEWLDRLEEYEAYRDV